MTALPTIERKWTFDLNNLVTSSPPTSSEDFTWLLYNKLIAWGAVPLGCCWHDGTGYAVSLPGDGVKNGKFENRSEMVWRVSTTFAGDKSWGVLQLPHGIGQLTMQMYRYSNSRMQMQMFWSRSGYDLSTGTTALRPELNENATEQALPQNTGNSAEKSICFYKPNGDGYRYHWAMAPDAFRLLISSESGGDFATLFSIEKLGDPASSLSAADQWVFLFGGYFGTNGINQFGPTVVYRDAFCFAHLGDAGHARLYLTGQVAENDRYPAEYSTTAQLSGPQNLDGGAYPIGSTIYAYSKTANARGYVGRLVDLWWGNRNVTPWTTLPSTGEKTHVHLSNALLHPWDGSTRCNNGAAADGGVPGDWDQPTKVYGTPASTPTTQIVCQNPLLVRGKP
jgi:hypothetical protein